MQVVNIFVLSSKVHAETFSRRYICVCIATTVYFSIQVQMNQRKIAIVSNRNTQQIAAGDVAAWNVLIAPQNGITAAAIFIVSEL